MARAASSQTVRSTTGRDALVILFVCFSVAIRNGCAGRVARCGKHSISGTEGMSSQEWAETVNCLGRMRLRVDRLFSVPRISWSSCSRGNHLCGVGPTAGTNDEGEGTRGQVQEVWSCRARCILRIRCNVGAYNTVKFSDSMVPAQYLPAMKRFDFEGATGRSSFGDKGDLRTANVTLLKVGDGKYLSLYRRAQLTFHRRVSAAFHQ